MNGRERVEKKNKNQYLVVKTVSRGESKRNPFS